MLVYFYLKTVNYAVVHVVVSVSRKFDFLSLCVFYRVIWETSVLLTKIIGNQSNAFRYSFVSFFCNARKYLKLLYNLFLNNKNN